MEVLKAILKRLENQTLPSLNGEEISCERSKDIKLNNNTVYFYCNNSIENIDLNSLMEAFKFFNNLNKKSRFTMKDFEVYFTHGCPTKLFFQLLVYLNLADINLVNGQYIGIKL